MNVEELTSSVRSYLYEKSSSPLAGSFIVSWIAWNWKFVLVVLSGESVGDKFLIISELYSTLYGWMGTGVAFPLLTSTAYIFVYPYPAKFVYKFARSRQLELNAARQKLEKGQLYDAEYVEEIKTEFFKIEEDLHRTIERKDSEIKRLNAELESGREMEARTQSPPSAESPSTSDQVLIPSKSQLLRFLSSSIEGNTRSDIFSEFPSLDELQIQVDLDELVQTNFVAFYRNAQLNQEMYKLEPRGRAWVLKKHHDAGNYGEEIREELKENMALMEKADAVKPEDIEKLPFPEGVTPPDKLSFTTAMLVHLNFDAWHEHKKVLAEMPTNEYLKFSKVIKKLKSIKDHALEIKEGREAEGASRSPYEMTFEDGVRTTIEFYKKELG